MGAWAGLMWLRTRTKWRALVNAVMNLALQYGELFAIAEDLLASQEGPLSVGRLVFTMNAVKIACLSTSSLQYLEQTPSLSANCQTPID